MEQFPQPTYKFPLAFTFNPNLMDGCPLQERYMTICYMLSGLKWADWKVNFELSPKGRLHVHGNLYINRVSRFYAYDIPYLIDCGSFEIDFIGNIPLLNESVIDDNDDLQHHFHTWQKYCQKQKTHMEDLFDLTEMRVFLDSTDKSDIAWIKRYRNLGEPLKTKFKRCAFLEQDEDFKDINSLI